MALYTRFLRLPLLIFLAALAFACGKKKDTGTEKHPIPVSVIEVARENVPAIFEFVGFTESSHPVEIRARVEGYLEKVAYVEGSLVKEGDLLFQIDPRPFQAVVEENEGTLKQQEAILWNATRTRERFEPLYKQNAASLRDLDNAIAAELEAIATVESSKASLEKAKLNLSFTTITAPVTGLSSRSRFWEGALISPGNDSLLTTISVLDPIWVYFSVSEGDLLKSADQEAKGELKLPEDKNFDVELILADGSTFPYHGRVDFASPTISQSTGTLNVRATFANPDGKLLPGSFVRARLSGAIRPNAIIVPQKALLQGRTGMFVYVLNKNNTAEVRPVSPGDWYEDYWVINSGLNPGDRVIVEGVNKVQPDWPLAITVVPNK